MLSEKDRNMDRTNERGCTHWLKRNHKTLIKSDSTLENVENS